MSLKLGDVAPNFQAETSVGKIDFYEYIGDGWAVLYSHPSDYTPVCTTELGRTAQLKSEFEKRNTKVLALSVDSVEDHLAKRKIVMWTSRSLPIKIVGFRNYMT